MVRIAVCSRGRRMPSSNPKSNCTTMATAIHATTWRNVRMAGEDSTGDPLVSGQYDDAYAAALNEECWLFSGRLRARKATENTFLRAMAATGRHNADSPTHG